VQLVQWKNQQMAFPRPIFHFPYPPLSPPDLHLIRLEGGNLRQLQINALTAASWRESWLSCTRKEISLGL